MRLLDPFAGIKLATGHMLFHFSFYIGSFVVDYYHDPANWCVNDCETVLDSENMQRILLAFRVQRWSHLAVFIFGIVSYLLKQDSHLPNNTAEEEANEERSALDSVKIYQRDTRKKVFSKFFDSASIFIYQGAVFLAQWTLVTSLECQDESIGETELCVQAAGPVYFWVLMEAIVFYTYMGSKVVYIILYSCKSNFQEGKSDSDMQKQTVDFLTHEELNVTWFAFNFVLSALPPCLMFLVDHEDDGNNLNGRDQSFRSIMYITWAMHIIQLLLNHQIIVDAVQDGDTRLEGEKVDPLLENEELRQWEYRPIGRKFQSKWWKVWILQAAAYTVVAWLYFTRQGAEIAYAVYIPVDFILFVGMAAYYFGQWYFAEKKQDQAKKMEELIKEKMNTGVVDLMKKVSTRSELNAMEAVSKRQLAENILGEAKVSGAADQKQESKNKLPAFNLSKDTYAMAYKALHWQTQHQMNLQPNEISNAFHSAAIVFIIQVIMLVVFSTVIYGEGNPSPVAMARTPLIMGLRVLVSILMHLQVESETRQGIKMMKYVINHTEDFQSPFVAYLIGFCQALTGIACEIGVVSFLSTMQDPMPIMMKYMAIAMVSKVDDFYSGALDDANRIKGPSKPLLIKNHRRDLNKRAEEYDYGIFFYAGRTFYKFVRTFYTSYHFYFFPYTALIITYIANAMRQSE